MTNNPDINEILLDIENNINTNTFSSLRNAARSLSDCSKILLHQFNKIYPQLSIIQDLQIDKKMGLLCNFNSEISKYNPTIDSIYKNRNKVDHSDFFIPSQNNLFESLKALREFVDYYNNIANKISSNKFINIKDIFNDELKITVDLSKSFSDNEIQQKIVQLQDTFNNIYSLSCYEKIKKIIDLKDLQTNILYLFVNKPNRKEIDDLEKELLFTDDDDYYGQMEIINKLIENLK